MQPDIKVLEEIGTGGFGKVYKCIYKGKKCAVKKIPISQATYPFKTVIAEFLVLSKIKHPQILKMLTFFQTNTDWNFVLEYMPNGSLRHILVKFKNNKWKFGESDLLSLFMDILNGVKHLHSVGIIHRDLKPENILVNENHRLKIADFGVSKLLLDNNPGHHTATGTITYMAPEVYLEQPYDKSVDIWALGIIFYEMAMQEYPFSKSDKSRIMNMRLSFVPPKIDYTRRNYSAGVQDILVMMLQRDPKKRAALDCICRLTLVENIYKQLVKEEKNYDA